MSLSCPKCRLELSDLTAGGSSLHFCPSCKGVWFTGSEFIHHLRARSGQANLIFSESVSRQTNFSCPQCWHLLKESPYKICAAETCAQSQFLLLDYCPQCRGVWLDEGELQKAEDLAKQIPSALTLTRPLASTVRSAAIPYSHIARRVLPFSPFIAFAVLFGILMIYTGFIGNVKYGHAHSEPAQLSACPVCKGAGSLWQRCESCMGRGRLALAQSSSQSCPSCDGTGHRGNTDPRCPQCGGLGWSGGAQQACGRCSGSGRVIEPERRTCATCHGTGQAMVREACSVCGGTGMSSVNKSWQCPSCHGSRSVETKKTCSYCQGGMVEAQRSRNCPVCLGNGKSTLEKSPCERCLGTGLLESASAANLCARCAGSGSILATGFTHASCTVCGGRGNVLSQTPCSSCRGTGIR